ncbi:MAG: ribonuclease J [Oscillospiraceae bacterium]|nr:ribonuclease J [Oscillospiraceae bacterium]
MAKSKKVLKVIPLGGLQEIGKNITVFEYNNEMIVVDCGLAFPEDDMLGIDVVLPDFTYLLKNSEMVRGVILTHAHEDHVGSLPYLLKELKVPVYGTRLTLGLVGSKLQEHRLSDKVKLQTVNQGQKLKLGSFEVEFIRTTHSIADTVALAIRTPVGLVVHTSDFKVDYTPIFSESIDLARFAQLGDEGVLLMLCDSTNIERAGYTMSERTVGDAFNRIFMEAVDSRILVATFASNVHRVQQIVDAAVRFGRHVVICGRSMQNVTSVATELGYLNCPEGVVIDINDIDKYQPQELVLLTTGSQGEPMSALTRIASNDFKKVEIMEGDFVVISASPIPGNEKNISKVVDELFKKGANVIYESLADVHVSGHACKEELKLMHSLVKPKFFMPVHGEYRHLKQHANLAVSLGMHEDNIFISENGRILELTQNSATLSGKVVSGSVFVDGLGVGDVGDVVLRDRRLLAEDGLIVVVVSYEKDTGQLISGPDIISRGFVYVKESETFLDETREVVKDALFNNDRNGSRRNWSSTKGVIKNVLRDFIYDRYKRCPMILPIVIEI